MRFLHTSDWQLGMTRHFLSKEAQARFTQARFDAIRNIARIATEQRCAFVVVAGDVFESNQVDRQTVHRALEALREVKVPVLLLPGNHDPLDAATVYRSTSFLGKRPDSVRVIEDSEPIRVVDGVEVVGAPWTSKRPLEDLLAGALRGLPPADGTIRIAIGHGAVDTLSPDGSSPSRIIVAAAEEALSQHRVHYIALGDRHSMTEVGSLRRIWYSGAPEPTDYDEVKPGFVLIVDADHDSCTVTDVRTGTWRFEEWPEVPVTSPDDIEIVRQRIEAVPDKERTVLKARLKGALPLRLDTTLRAVLNHGRDLLAALELREEEYAVVPEGKDFEALAFSGFVRTTAEELMTKAKAEGPGAAEARDALALLIRLAVGEA